MNEREGASRRVPVALLVLTLLCAAVGSIDTVGFDWGLPHTVAPHPDDVAKPALTAMQEKFLGQTKYGKVHLLTLAAAYTPYLAYEWWAGELSFDAADSGSGASAFKDPVGSTITLLRIARGVSVALHLGTVVLLFLGVWLSTRSIAGGFVAGVLWGFSPLVTFFAKSSNVDVPLCFWLTASGIAAATAARRPTGKRLAAFGLLAILAVCTKEQAPFALAPICLLLGLAVLVRHPKGLLRGALDLVLATLLGLLVYALLTDLLWNPSLWTERIDQWRHNLNWFKGVTAADMTGTDLTKLGFRTYLDIGGPGVAVLSGLAIVRTLVRPDERSVALLLVMLFYPVALTLYLGYIQPRFFFPVVLAGVALIGLQTAKITSSGGSRMGPQLLFSILAAVCVVTTMGYAGLVGHAMEQESRRPALDWVESEVARRGGPREEGAGALAGWTVTSYQNENLLPGVKALGATLVREPRMTKEAFEASRPEVVIVADNFNWSWKPAERQFVQWLEQGPEGYQRVAFGPNTDGGPTFVLPSGPRSRVLPNVTVLFREDVIR